MKLKSILIWLALLISLYIYLFYRTENTVVNLVFVKLFSLEVYHRIRFFVDSNIRLNNVIIYSIPHALWTFVITMSSYSYQVKVANFIVKLKYVPLFLILFFEGFQYLGILHGTFDWNDVILSVLFWGIAIAFNYKIEKRFIGSLDKGELFCLMSYCIVFLAHVQK